MKCSFSIDHYLECLRYASDQGYTIAPVCEYYRYNGKDKLLLLRHDVDLSLNFAYQMAMAEHDQHYQSTYYILMHSPTFNVLSPKGIDIIKTISDMGHEIGWQVDTRYLLPSEHYILREMIGVEHHIRSYAQHFPSLTKKPTVTGFIDSRELPIKYLSDSGRNWREGCLCEHIGKEKHMQVLTHPIWWMLNTNSREETVGKLMTDRTNEAIESVNDFRETLSNYVRDEIGASGDWQQRVRV